MTSLSSLLPAPRNVSLAALQQQKQLEQARLDAPSTEPTPAASNLPPAYRHRKNWVPKTLADFGDGGAFPEIHFAQYPLDMGRKKTGSSVKTLALRVNDQGEIQYDALAKYGHDPKTTVHSQLKDLMPKDRREGDSSFERPTEEEEEATAQRTNEALQKIVAEKTKSMKPKSAVNISAPSSQYVKYTPNAPGQNGTVQSKIIRMVEAQVDPMEPPRFKHKKVPAAPSSPPAPVMHSPPRKITAEQQKEWYIPPSISNWKNARGYTIPLDKRLAADGRGLQEVTINDNFAKFAEALYIAERQAREEVEKRAQMVKKLSEKEKEAKESHLRALAQKAREERAGFAGGADDLRDSVDEDRPAAREEGETDEAYKEREELRRDRARDIQRQIRMSHMSSETKAKMMARHLDRDVGEKMALGMSKPTIGSESLYDQRLFNQTQGMSSGFRGEEAYDIYDKPLFRGTTTSIYRPKNVDGEIYGGDAEKEFERLQDQDRFVPDKGFQGTETAAPRDGPVQFEESVDDPFGIDKFLTEATKAKRTLDSVGQRTMHASSSGPRESYTSRPSRDNVQFESSKRRRQD